MLRIPHTLAVALILAIPVPVSVVRSAQPPARESGARTRTSTLSAASAEARFLGLINAERARRGLKPLVIEDSLVEASRLHCREMARLGYFDHESPVPENRTPADRWERVAPQTPDDYTLGENLFYGSAPDPAWGHRSLMESSPHRANILGSAYSRVGIGVHIASDGQMWVTQMFLS